MEITLEAIISLLGLFVGGGGGAFFMWKWQRRKAKAEAREAETAATKELQDLYQQMLADAKADREDRLAQNEELRSERDHYKTERNELRDEVEKLLAYYMGKNTMERQNFIIDNLVIEEDIPEEEEVYD